MKCSNCKFLFTLPLDNARQDYHVCEKGVWEGPEIAFGHDYGLDCKEFRELDVVKILQKYDQIMELAWEDAKTIDDGGEWPECIFTDPVDIETYNNEVKRLLKNAR